MIKNLTVAVVIPTWNEAESLPRLLNSLVCQTQPAERILVVDGNSSDATVAIARSAKVDLLVCGTRGRGTQIAAGIRELTQDVIVVGHADMQFPADALERIRHYFQLHPECPGGCLGHRFASTRCWYRLIEWFDRHRASRGLSYGDQAQFFRRELLIANGGFPEQPFLEDLELATRLRTLGTPAYLDQPVLVSPRRFERHGLLWTIIRNWRIRQKYRREGHSSVAQLYAEYYQWYNEEVNNNHFPGTRI